MILEKLNKKVNPKENIESLGNGMVRMKEGWIWEQGSRYLN